MSSPRVTFNLTCGKDVTELQNLASLRLSSFAESNQMQQKNFDVSPKGYFMYNVPSSSCLSLEHRVTESGDSRDQYRNDLSQ